MNFLKWKRIEIKRHRNRTPTLATVSLTKLLDNNGTKIFSKQVFKQTQIFIYNKNKHLLADTCEPLARKSI